MINDYQSDEDEVELSVDATFSMTNDKSLMQTTRRTVTPSVAEMWQETFPRTCRFFRSRRKAAALRDLMHNLLLSRTGIDRDQYDIEFTLSHIEFKNSMICQLVIKPVQNIKLFIFCLMHNPVTEK
jgi:hypothetical protein